MKIFTKSPLKLAVSKKKKQSQGCKYGQVDKEVFKQDTKNCVIFKRDKSHAQQLTF